MDFLTAARARVGGPFRCSTFRWCLKKDTSLVVVSMRSTMPALSYILIEHLPNAQHDAGLVVHLDRALAEAVLHAGAFDTGGELRADLLRQLWCDLAAEEGGDLLSLHAQHG